MKRVNLQKIFMIGMLGLMIFPSLAPADSVPLKASVKSAANDETVILNVGDRVKVTIYPEDQYIKGGEMEVSSEGNITLSLVGKIAAAGKSIPEIEREIAKIIDADYLVNPEVVIEVLSSKKNILHISILGQVKKPGTYELQSDKKNFSLLEAISEAGGFSDVANIKKIKIMRKKDGKTAIIRANAESIIGGNSPDIPLEDNDVIHVSESLF